MFNFRALNFLFFPVALNLSSICAFLVIVLYTFILDLRAMKELINILNIWHMSTVEQWHEGKSLQSRSPFLILHNLPFDTLSLCTRGFSTPSENFWFMRHFNCSSFKIEIVTNWARFQLKGVCRILFFSCELSLMLLDIVIFIINL